MLARRFTPSSMAIYLSKNTPYVKMHRYELYQKLYNLSLQKYSLQQYFNKKLPLPA